jgi:hypothetical protein
MRASSRLQGDPFSMATRARVAELEARGVPREVAVERVARQFATRGGARSPKLRQRLKELGR